MMPPAYDGGMMMHRPMKMLAAGVTLALLFSVTARADEVDDLLALKARNRDRVKHFAAEFSVETDQPKTLPNHKTVRFRYRMTLDRIHPAGMKDVLHPWHMEIEVLEPGKSKIRVEGERVSVQMADGRWQDMPLPDEYKKQFSEMSERALGQDPAAQRRAMDIKVLRHNNPMFGPVTRTVEYRPKGQQKLFASMEEDVDGNALPLATRLYDDAGAETVRMKVTKHRMASGIPVLEAMEMVSRTPAGEIVGRMTCSNVIVETQP